MERELYVRLNLVANFAGAAKEAAESLRSIAGGIDDLKNLSIPLGTLTGQMADFRDKVNSAQLATGKLSTKLKEIAELGTPSKDAVDRIVSSVLGLEGASAKADVSVAGLGKKVKETAVAAAAAAPATQDLTKAVATLGTEATASMEELNALVGAVRTLEREVSRIKPRPIIALTPQDREALTEIHAITRAIRELDASLSVPRHLSLVVQQPGALVVQPSFVRRGAPYIPGQKALPGDILGQWDHDEATFVNAGRGAPPGIMPPPYGSRVLSGGGPLLALPGGVAGAAWGAGGVPGRPYMGPPPIDVMTVGDYTAPGPRALPPGKDPSFYWGQGPGAPDGFNWRVWNARQRERMGNDLGASDETIAGMGGINMRWVRENMPLNMGKSMSDLGKEGLRAGNTIQSTGTASLVNAVMIGGLMVPVVKSMTDIKDLFARTYEALKSSGATDENARKFAQGVADMSKQFGGDYRGNVSAVYNFASALPSTANIDYNKPEDAKKLTEAFGKIIKLQIAGSSSTHPMSMEETTLNVLATAENLGLHMRNATEVSKAIDTVTNATIQMKNKTSTEADLFANSVKAIGPIAANLGIPWEQTVGLIAIEAEGKRRGAPAGQDIKRLFSRQALPPKQLQELMTLTHGGVSMYNEKGEAKNLFEWIDSIGKFEKDNNLPPQVKAKMEGLLSGLYAAPGASLMIRKIQEIGGAAGMEKYVHDLLYKPLAGTKPGDSPLEGAFKARTTGNLLNRAQRTENHFLDEAGKTFDLLEPKMEKFLDGVDGLIDAWGRLDPATKENIVTWTAWLGIGSAVAGVVLMISGNFIKLGSAIMLGLGGLVQLADHITGFKALEGVWGKVLSPLRGIGPIALEAVAAIDLIPAAIIAVPVALIALTAAWHNNWGNIRENTRAAIESIKNLLGGLAEGLGYQLARMQRGISDWFAQHKDSMGKDILDGIIGGIGDLFNIGKGLAQTLWDGMVSVWNAPGKLGDFLRAKFDVGQKEGDLAGPNSMGGAASALAGGQAFADSRKSGAQAANIWTDGMIGGLNTAPAGVKGALQKTRNLFHSSEPKDSSSPLHGLGESGKMAADAWIAGAIMGIGQAHAKVKKALKGPVDAFITLKSETVEQVKDLAAKIEAELHAVGAKTRQGLIDIFDPKTHHITRVSGSVQAYRSAAAQFHGTKDTSVQQAEDYLNKIKRELEHHLPVDMDKVLLHMEHLSTAALSAHATEEINGMIDKVRKAWEKFPNTIGEEFKKAKEKFATELSTIGSAGDSFDLIKEQQDRKVQKQLDSIKDSSMPTSKELNNVIGAESLEHDKLETSLLKEIEAEKKLAEIKADLKTKIEALSGSDRLQQQERDNLKAQLAELDVEYNTVDDRILKQKEDIDALTTSMEKQTEAIKDARDTWEGLFRDVLKKTQGELQTRPLKGIADHIQGYFELQNSPKGSAGSNFHRQQANNFANNVIQNLFQDMFDVSGTSTLGILHSKGAHKKDPETTTYYTKTGTQLDKIDKNTQYVHVDPQTSTFQNQSKDLLGQINASAKAIAANTVKSATGATDKPSPVWISSQTGGGVDLGQQIGDATTGMAAQNTSDLQAMQDVLSTGAMENMQVPETKTSLEKFQGMMGQIGDYYSIYEGLRAGGIGGGIQAGMGAAALTGNPYLIGAAALAGFIGIGPHETPAQQPDLSDPYYQQLLPNLAGTQQMLGNQMIQPNEQYSIYAGNQNLAQQLYTFLSNPASLTGLNPAQIQSIQQLKALAGGSPTGLEIKSEHQGVATLQSGQQIKVTDLENLIQNVSGIMTQFQNSMLTQQQNADRLASSFTTRTLMGPSGFVMPDLAGGSSVSSGAGMGASRMPSAGAGASPSGFRRSMGQMQVQIQILQGANVQSGKDVQTAIDNSLPAIAQAVQQGNYAANRLMGDYVSETF